MMPPMLPLALLGLLLAMPAAGAEHPLTDATELLFESRTPGLTGGGVSLSVDRAHGHSFRLLEPTQLTGLGIGNLVSFADDISVFAAIHRIGTSFSIPDVVNDSSLLGTALIELNAGPASDGFAALDLTLEPGWYAILTGAGRYGASAGNSQVTMTNTGTATTANSYGPYNMAYDTGARSLQGVSTRFFVEGSTIAAPTDPNRYLMETARPSAWFTGESQPISAQSFRGTRFEITRPTRIDSVGGWFRNGSGEILAAIVTLSGPTALPLPPSNAQFINSVVGSTLIPVADLADEYSADFGGLELAPGHYALVFGSGVLGAGGEAQMMVVNDQLVTDQSLIWLGSSWVQINPLWRMVLTGFLPDLQAGPELLNFGDVLVGQAAALAVTIDSFNTDGGVQLLDLQLAGSDPEFFSLSPAADDCLANPLPGASSCSFDVHFQPGVIGPRTASLVISSDGLPETIEIALAGSGVQPALSLAPASLSFELIVGQLGSLDLELGNSGDGPLIWNLALTEAENCQAGPAPDWLSALPLDGVVEPGDTRAISVTASATVLAAGPYSALLCLSSNDPDNEVVTVPVSLTVRSPALTFEPAALDFDNIVIGMDSPPQTALLINQGDAPASALTIPAPSEFSVDASACGEALAAGDSCDIQVRYSPTTAGPVSTVLEAGSAEGISANLALSGTGLEPALLSVNPNSLNFGPVVAPRTRQLSLAVANSGGVSLSLATLLIDGDTGVFEFGASSCAPGTVLAPTETCEIELVFAPPAIGSYSATLQLSADDGQQLAVSLSGLGVDDPLFSDRFEGLDY